MDQISTLVKEFITPFEEFFCVALLARAPGSPAMARVIVICEHADGVAGESRIVVPMGSGTVQGLLERVKRRVGSNE